MAIENKIRFRVCASSCTDIALLWVSWPIAGLPCFYGLCKTNILEYCSPVWNPVYIGDIKRIEAVQRRFTKKLSGYRHLSHDARLHLLGAESQELRRLKLDLIMMYKILHGLLAVDTLFNVRLDDRTRGDFKILKPHCNVNSRAHSFACRRLNCWNSLPNDVRNASSVFVFKRLLSKCDFTCQLLCYSTTA